MTTATKDARALAGIIRRGEDPSMYGFELDKDYIVEETRDGRRYMVHESLMPLSYHSVHTFPFFSITYPPVIPPAFVPLETAERYLQ